MATPKKQSLIIGSKSYSILTSADEGRLLEVADMVQKMVKEMDPKLTQEERLLLSVMELAMKLVDIKYSLFDLSGGVGE